MKRIIVAILLIAGMITFLNCEKVVDNQKKSVDNEEKRVTIPEWYPSTISNYEPYELSVIKPPYVRVELNPGQTEFTEDEFIRCAGQFIDQRKELIGADSKSLTLVKVEKPSIRTWRLYYHQTNSYKFEIEMGYGSVGLSTSNGIVNLLTSSIIPVVPVPDEPIVSDDVIRESIIGETLTYYDYGGNLIEYEVKEDAIVLGDLVIFPLLKEDTLEIRLCRKVEVMQGGVTCWFLFYDVITGENIHVRCDIWS